MALILGTEYCRVDSNWRFRLPIAFKSQLGEDEKRFVIRQGTFSSQCLELWTYAGFQIEMESLDKMFNPYNPVDQMLKRQLTRANLVDLDSNDRLMIPPERQAVFGDKVKDIVLQSTGRCIEIWGREAYDKMNSEVVDLASMVAQRLGQQHDVPPASDAQ